MRGVECVRMPGFGGKREAGGGGRAGGSRGLGVMGGARRWEESTARGGAKVGVEAEPRASGGSG